MYDIYKNENIPLEVEGKVKHIELYKGGNITLTIENKSGKTIYAAIDPTFKRIIKKNDFFSKKANTNKCILERNDSIIYLDCYKIPQDIRDSLGSIEEWSREIEGKWQIKK